MVVWYFNKREILRLWTRFVLVGLLVLLSAGCSGQVTARPAPVHTAQNQSSVAETKQQSKQPPSPGTGTLTSGQLDESPYNGNNGNVSNGNAQTDLKKDATQLSDKQTSSTSEPLVFFKGSGDKKAVALTFDDGPDTYYTVKVLDILNKEGVHATFFVVGLNAQAHPGMLRRIVQEGHVLGNHSWNHPDLTRLTLAQAVEQIERTDEIVYKETGKRMFLLRPPYGKLNTSSNSSFTAWVSPLLTGVWTLATGQVRRPPKSCSMSETKRDRVAYSATLARSARTFE